MDPRTFLRPGALPLRDLPHEGEQARELPVDLEDGRPAVVAFLRHTGCPFAEATMHALRDAAGRAPQVQWIAISHASEEATARWCEAVGGRGGVVVASDPSRRAYADWGLGLTGAGHFVGPRSLAAAAKLARHGTRNRHPNGTRWQSAGTFAVDRAGIVCWRSLPTHAGELPDLTSAVDAVG